MKKTKQRLQNLNLKEDRILNRKELKNITGGNGFPCTTDTDCGYGYCDGSTLTCEDEGTISCAYYLPNGSASGGPIVTYNVSKATALDAISGISGARYCCDNCATASWYGI